MGSKQRRQQRELRTRVQMERDGMSPELIAKELERQRFAELVEHHGLAKARDIVYSEQPDQPADGCYRPSRVDPLLRGDARAVGQAADAVKRGRTVTHWQYDAREATG